MTITSNKRKVTVVTVTYNAQEHLEQTIKSVIKQDYSNVEYIIIDGGSTDGTIDIIKKYEDHIAYWISEPDHGIYDAMNKGIDVATGEWINFMNAGDCFCEIGTILKVMENLSDDTDIISGDIYSIDLNNNKAYRSAPREGYAYDGMFCYHQTMFTKVNIMKMLKFDTSFKVAGDYDFVMKCYVAKHKFQFLDFAVANFMEGGISSKYLLNAKIEDMFIQSKHLNNSEDVFYKNSYAVFQSFNENNNRLFGKLFNNLTSEFERLELSNRKFILYGFGNIGQLIYNKFGNNIIKVVDQNYDKLNNDFDMEIIKPDDLIYFKNDFVLISVFGREKEIISFLNSIGIENILLFNLDPK